MSSIFSGSPLWSGDHAYVTAHADFLHHQIGPGTPELHYLIEIITEGES